MVCRQRQRGQQGFYSEKGRAERHLGSGYVCVCMCTYIYIYIYIYESEQGASKEREPAGAEEKTERESRLIRETRMSNLPG